MIGLFLEAGLFLQGVSWLLAMRPVPTIWRVPLVSRAGDSLDLDTGYPAKARWKLWMHELTGGKLCWEDLRILQVPENAG